MGFSNMMMQAAKSNWCPFNSFSNIFFLFHHKHVMVEKLLKLLIYKVDGDLLKTIVLKDLKASNIEDRTEISFLHGL